MRGLSLRLPARWAELEKLRRHPLPLSSVSGCRPTVSGIRTEPRSNAQIKDDSGPRPGRKADGLGIARPDPATLPVLLAGPALDPTTVRYALPPRLPIHSPPKLRLPGRSARTADDASDQPVGRLLRRRGRGGAEHHVEGRRSAAGRGGQIVPALQHRDPAAAAVLGGEVLDPAREHAEPPVRHGAPAQGVVGVGVVPGAHDDEIGFEPSAGSGARQASIALAGKQNQ